MDRDVTRFLTILNTVMCLVHGGLMLVTVSAGNTDLRVPVYHPTLSLRVEDVNGTRGWTLAPDGAEAVGEIPLTLACAAFFALSSFFHLGNVALWRDSYFEGISRARCPSRWIEYALSAPIMSAFLIAYTTSTTLFLDIVAIFSLTTMTMFFGHLQEVIARPGPGDAWMPADAVERYSAHALGWVPQLTAWFMILYQFSKGFEARVTDSKTGEERGAPDFVKYIVYLEALLFWSFGFVQLSVLGRPPSKYWQGEVTYQILSLVSKALLGALLLTNVLVLGSFAEAFADA